MMMFKKKLLLSIAFSLLSLPAQAICGSLLSGNPALRLMHLYSSGTEDMKTINPYLINITAIYEINGQRHVNEVRDYILWYLDHLNYPDKDGLTGTIYDYEILESGEEKSTGYYDSIDGYAGTFLYLLNLYHALTGDNALIEINLEKIKDIGYLIPYLQGEDGLIKARTKDKDEIKYLMDNCESYAGIKAFNELLERTGHGREAYYIDTETGIKNAILESLYDTKNNNFYWASDKNIKHVSDWSILYPDAIAQLFPIYLGLLDEEEKRKALWQEFNKRYAHMQKDFPVEQRMIYELTGKFFMSNFKHKR